ncbi:hypothetical protein SARC_05296 [Sphaeroforma arctica JP610]|uniref:Apoptosis-inducing factor 1, mitochondrial n=1 Tax=Sphaeroforma arctica JP610 TaxID=667725 RepID=A0A0L0G0R3_9EUKA|nr:hypothetical protein SARC_05296 [Sphaeroforma arctica JP610]KNC82426.1 hypothetical protein SARC_05296 [Sphaeroforma arctica JP610]|eukprot:XP_014156328.1 hypothetical protein SARC_05296 [Sphaeroforma arctica JP610]
MSWLSVRTRIGPSLGRSLSKATRTHITPRRALSSRVPQGPIGNQMILVGGVSVALAAAAISSSPNSWFGLPKVVKEVAEEVIAILPEDQSENDAKVEVEEPTQSNKTVASSQNITNPYVLVGAGTASFSALQTILEKDVNAKVVMIGDEDELPYMRPPLSKELWYGPSESGDLKFKDIGHNDRSVYLQHTQDTQYVDSVEALQAKEGQGVAFIKGVKVVGLDAKEKRLTLSNGDTVVYEKLLLATGGSPRTVSELENAEEEVKSHVTLFRKIEDFRKLKEISDGAESLVVLGGGFLGSELAIALAHKGATSNMKVTQVFPEHGNMGFLLPQYLSTATTEFMRNENVNVIPSASVESASMSNGKVILKLTNGSEISTDHVVVAAGIEPNVELAQQARLEIDPKFGGVLVNSELAARSDIYAAGDCASFHDITLGRRLVEHHDHAVVSGHLAGENMANSTQRKSFEHQSMFWGDLGPKLGYEAIGIIDSELETVGVWAKAKSSTAAQPSGENSGTITLAERQKQDEDSEVFNKGVVFYLRNKKVVGVLLWNLFDKIPTARRVVKDAKQVDDFSELAKVFNVHQ